MLTLLTLDIRLLDLAIDATVDAAFDAYNKRAKRLAAERGQERLEKEVPLTLHVTDNASVDEVYELIPYATVKEIAESHGLSKWDINQQGRPAYRNVRAKSDRWIVPISDGSGGF